MTDQHKFKILVITAATGCVLMLAYSFFDGRLAQLGEYAQRKAYYEQVLSKKGLGLHKAMYWKEKE